MNLLTCQHLLALFASFTKRTLVMCCALLNNEILMMERTKLITKMFMLFLKLNPLWLNNDLRFLIKIEKHPLEEV